MYKWTLQLGKRLTQSSALLHDQTADAYVKETAIRLKPSDSLMHTNKLNCKKNLGVVFQDGYFKCVSIFNNHKTRFKVH